MKQHERGFITIEILISIIFMSLLALGGGMTAIQVLKGTDQCESYMAASRQVQNAGYWIVRDAQMADSVTTDNLSSTEFLVLSWTENDESDNTTQHLVTYFFEDILEDHGTLKRNHSSSAGLNNETLVAQYVYFDSTDPVNTSNVSYINNVLAVKLVATFGDKSRTEEYRVSCRPDL